MQQILSLLQIAIHYIQPVLSNFPYYLNTIIEVIGAITVIASVVVKLTKTPNDDLALSNFKFKVHKFLAWLPTVGYNPHQDVVNQFELVDVEAEEAKEEKTNPGA